MWFGVIFGFGAALCNAVGYLFSARFLRECPSPTRLLLSAQAGMMVLSLPFVFLLYPPDGIAQEGTFAGLLAAWVGLFWLGQFGFFTTQKHIEASRLASLLGLKIIVLTLIFIGVSRRLPDCRQLIAVAIAAAAAALMNWSRAGRITPAGCGILFVTLVCYSCCDITETKLVLLAKGDGTMLRSALFTTALAYAALGAVSLPAAVAVKLTRRQLLLGFPYALLWLVSQVLLMACFGLINPVFGNVILASRGLFAVLFGALLACCGWKNLDADISAARWLRRAAAAILMIAAIALYSWAAA